MLRTVIWFIYFWLYLIFKLPTYYKVRRLEAEGKITEHDAVTRKVVGIWARRLLKLAGAEVSVSGLENMPKGPAVYVSNHRGYFDIPTLLGYLGEDTKPLLAKKELQKLPFIRDWMTELRCVFIDRQNMRAAAAALSEASGWVAKGYSMVVFPEGTRTRGGFLDEFKSGAFKIAQKNKVPVVPICMTGTDDLMKVGSLAIHPAKVTLTVLEPIDTSGFTKEDWRSLPERTHAIVAEELKRRLGE